MSLLEYFVAGATARASAEIVGTQANTAISFYMRLRHLIASKLLSYEFGGEVEIDKSYFGGTRKGKRGSGAARCTLRSYRMPKQRLCCLLSKRRFALTALFTRMRFMPIMPLM